MARRSDHTPQELKTLILDAALAVVREQGVAALNARAIAGKAGYAVGTLYNQFKSLDDIVLHVNAETLALLNKKLAGADNVEGLLDRYLQFTRKEPARWRLLSMYPIDAAALPAWYRERIGENFATVEAVLRREVGEAAQEAARVLWASIQGIMLMGLQGRLATSGAGEARQLAEALVRGYLAGLKKR